MTKEKKKIIIVEDDQAIVEMYKDKLKLEGFNVATVMDGKKAMSRIKQGADLILLDILMPGLNGFEILKKIKNNAETSSIPVLVLTNIGTDSFDSDKKLAISLGATDYLIKALNTPDQVVEKINSTLAESK